MSANEERISNQSMDLGEFNKDRLLEMFPIFRTEGGGVDFDRLKLALGESVEVGKEVFGMRWPGKADSIRLANAPSLGTLSPNEKESVNFDSTHNLIIEGDNLEALKLLQKSYQGKVKMIYVDPPYNTGNDFVYEDDFADGIKNYLQQTGQIDDEGNRLSTNSETDGRFHSNWLNMMYPRLILARNLLTQDGVIFLSIDDNEVNNLRHIADDIFGQSNFISQFVWAAGRKNDSKFVSNSHEYILCYCNNFESLKSVIGEWRTRKDGLDPIYSEYRRLTKLHGSNFAKVTSDLKDWFKSLPDGDPSKRHRYYSTVDARGVYFPDNISWPGSGGPKYEILHPITKKPVTVPSRGWRIADPEKMKALIADDRVHFGPDETNVPCAKAYLTDREYEVPYSVFYQDGRGATKRLRELMGGDCFENPKDETILQKLIEFAAPPDSVIIDFFAGSGTTAHAVMAQNAKDGGKRKFILVQLPEKVDPESEAAKAGFDNIADITKERVRRAGKKIIEESDGKLKLEGEEALDFGFRVLKLNESNIEDWNSEEASKSPKDLMDALKTTRLKSGRSEQDVVFEVLVKYGIELTSSVEELKVGKGSVWKIAGGDLIVVVAPGLANDDLNAIVKMSPKVVVMLDEAFVPEALKTNARATFKDAKIELKTF